MIAGDDIAVVVNLSRVSPVRFPCFICGGCESAAVVLLACRFSVNFWFISFCCWSAINVQ